MLLNLLLNVMTFNKRFRSILSFLCRADLSRNIFFLCRPVSLICVVRVYMWSRVQGSRLPRLNWLCPLPVFGHLQGPVMLSLLCSSLCASRRRLRTAPRPRLWTRLKTPSQDTPQTSFLDTSKAPFLDTFKAPLCYLCCDRLCAPQDAVSGHPAGLVSGHLQGPVSGNVLRPRYVVSAVLVSVRLKTPSQDTPQASSLDTSKASSLDTF